MTNTQKFTVQKPINTVEASNKYFDWVSDWVTPTHCPLKPIVDESIVVHLIQVTPDLNTEETLREIDELGFKPIPSNYLLGLGAEYPEVHSQCKFVTSLDKNNLFTDCYNEPSFLCLGYNISRGLDLWGGKDVLDIWGKQWWFAVTPKKSLKV